MIFFFIYCVPGPKLLFYTKLYNIGTITGLILKDEGLENRKVT